MKNINVVRLEMVRDRTIAYGKRQVSGPADLAEIGYELLGRSDKESLLVICFNAKNSINAVNVVATGSSTGIALTPMEVFKAPIISNAAAIAILHNHTSGYTSPSIEDIKITERLIEAGKLLGIMVVDHVIVGDKEYFSFVENNVCNFT
jgi:DNA repair protein RadC